ncbi:MAG: TraM recognition domain-containing protein [Chloroflexi bacterium]|jgi:hypothetical protein|nr:TraM recognition domain-containing protein [Chloroflexota bacterium]
MTTRKRATNNPYLTGIVPDRAGRITVGSELKRLLGGPLRLVETLIFVLGSFLMALAGALDLLSVWLYTVSHHTRADPRPVVNVFKCLQDQTHKLCQNVVWASPASAKRLTLYPWHDFDLTNRFEPYLFIGYFALAALAFVAIGNPKVAGVGRNLRLVLGLKSGGKTSESVGLFDLTAAAGGGPVPRAVFDADRPEEFWRTHMLLGQYTPRYWESDPGYFWFDKAARPVPYWLSLPIMRTGLVIVAPQGSGKTASVFKPLRSFMERSDSMAIFYDVKSSENTNGTGTDFPPELFNLNFDAARADSIKLNVFSGQTPAQAGERLAEALIPDLGGDKAYFSNNAKSAMATIVACYHASYKVYPTLVQILSFLSDTETLEDLNGQLVSRLGRKNYQEAFRLSTLLRRVISLSENKNSDTLGSLATALEPLVTDVAARLLVTNPEPGAFTIDDLLKEPRLVRLALPVANNPRIYPIIGRLVLAQFTYSVLSPECNRQIFKLIAVDEARFFITDSVANGMAQARSNNAGFALSFQTLTQVRDEALLDNIFANAGSKMVMGKVSDKDAERYSRLFGTVEMPYVSHSRGESSGTNKNSGSSYSRGLEFEMFSSGMSSHESRSSRSTSAGRSTSTGSNQGTNLSTRARRRFLDSEVRELEQRHAIIESSDDQGRQWFAQVVNMDFGTIEKLEEEVNDQIKRLVKKGRKGKTVHEQPVEIAPIRAAGLQTTGRQRFKVRFMPATMPPPKADPETEPAPASSEAVPAVTNQGAEAQPIVAVEGEVISAENMDLDQIELMEEILAAAGITGRQATQLVEFTLFNKRSAEDLKRLVEYSKEKNPDSLAAYVTSLVRKNKYPGTVMSNRKSSHAQEPTQS